VKLELDKQRATARIECDDDVIWGDPGTGGRARIHGWSKRQWRHLDTCQFETVLEAGAPSVKEAAQLPGLGREQANRIMKRAVERGGGPGAQSRAAQAHGAGG
jgi:hypothetical protein